VTSFPLHSTRVEISLMMVFNRNRSQVFTSKWGPSAMSSSPRSSSDYRDWTETRLGWSRSRKRIVGLGPGLVNF